MSDTNYCALNTITDDQVRKVIRAFWRRIYPYRNDYGIELPSQMPTEFLSHMATALVWVDQDAISAEQLRTAEQERDQYKEHSDNWVYYQDMMKKNGLAGITDLLTKYHAHERELESLSAQLKAAQEQEPVLYQVKMGVSHVACFRSKDTAQQAADEENKRHALSGSWASFTVHPLYAAPIPAQPSGALAVPVFFAREDMSGAVSAGNHSAGTEYERSLYCVPLYTDLNPAKPSPVVAAPDWENEAKRAFWAGLEIGACFGGVQILPRWNEYIAKRKSELPEQSPRITEQDAREAIEKLDHVLKMNKDVMTNTGVVYIREVRALLNKLNARKAQPQDLEGGSDV